MAEPFDPELERVRVQGVVDRIRTGGSAALRECVEESQGVSCCATLWSTPRDLDRVLGVLAEAERRSLEAFVRRCEGLAAARARTRHEFGVVACCVPPGALHDLQGFLASVVALRAQGCPQLLLGVPDARARVAAALALVAVDGVLLAGGAAAVAAFAHGVAPAPRCDLVLGWSPRALRPLARRGEHGVVVDLAALTLHEASAHDGGECEADADALVTRALAFVDAIVLARS